MSEPIPEAIPTSADPRSRRPVKRARTNNNAFAAQADEIENLMWDPSRPVELPPLSSESKAILAPPPEIVANVQGSSAGAGSGEFHVYKASRRREYERLKAMDDEAKKEDEDGKWVRDQEEKRKADEERTRRNREKRNKRKKGKGGKESTPGPDVEEKHETEATKKNGVKPLKLPKRDIEKNAEEDENGVVQEAGITIHDDS